MGDTRAIMGVVLSAGGSTRMGQPKALLLLAGQPLIRHHIAALSQVCGRIRVVVGAHAEAIRAILPPTVEVVENPHWQTTGPAESLALALADSSAQQAVVTPVDVPPAPLEVLTALGQGPAPAVVVVGGQPGHPVRIDVLAARRDLARGWTLREHLVRARPIDVAWPAALLNLNTPAQWAAYQDSQAREPEPA